jgi:hypothetical protein
MMHGHEVDSNTMQAGVSPTFGCASWSLWILAAVAGTAVGWRLGWRLSILVSGQLASPTLGLTVGLVLGFSQWIILRGYMPRAGWWILASGLGWAAGFPLGAGLSYLVGLMDIWFGVMVGAMVGLFTGVPQWLLLQRQSGYAAWWAPASIFAWAAALMFYRGGPSWMGAYYGLMVGIATGLALFGILGFARQAT